jgi:hypothetical protein
MPKPTVIPIATRGDVRRCIQRAQTASSILRTPGHRFAGPGEREALAALLDALVTIASHRLDPQHEPAPDAYHGGEDVVGDLFDGRAA